MFVTFILWKFNYMPWEGGQRAVGKAENNKMEQNFHLASLNMLSVCLTWVK